MAAFGKADVWYVTFADLLTLLLCFFLAIIALSPLSPYSLKTEPVSKNKQDFEIQQRNKASGTDIASNYIEVDRTLVSFRAADLELSELKLNQTAVESLISQMIREGYQVRQVLIRACSGGQGDEAWQSSQQLALNVSRQLVDAGIRKDSIKLAALGPLCSLNGEEGESILNVIYEKFLEPKEHGRR